METFARPWHAEVKGQSKDEPEVQPISDELSRLLKQSKVNSLRHQEVLQVQFTESQEFISRNLDEIQAVLAGFIETVTDVRITDWRRESHQLLKLGRKSVDTLERFCEDIEQPLKESCEELELATFQSVKTLNATIDSFYSDSFRRLIHKTEQSIEQVTKETIRDIVVMRRRFNWVGCVVAGLIALIVAVGFSSYLNAEWPWETHTKASVQRNIGQAATTVWPQLSHNDQQAILINLSEMH